MNRQVITVSEISKIRFEVKKTDASKTLEMEK